MASIEGFRPFGRDDLRMALLITRREVRDSFRDWRIIIPIVLLTLVFPGLATFTARILFNFTAQYGATLIGDRLVPFLLLVVGFFPMSFSLVIALETFVGEKERKSLEPLLATPLTNTQLYVGKVLAAIVPPMFASYLGILVYLGGLLIATDWFMPPLLMLQILLLSTVQGIIMVAAAVIISGQTTSVRAANLLASFIIVPVALLLQMEAIVMFWGNNDGLWWLILALAITGVLLVRMGIKTFNREELLGSDIDQLKIGKFIGRYFNRVAARESGRTRFSVARWYRALFAFLPHLRVPSTVMIIALVGGFAVGYFLTSIYPLPAGLSAAFEGDQIAANAAHLDEIASRLPLTIFYQNLRAVVLAAILGIFTLGVTDILIFMLPWVLVGYLSAQLALVGENAALFILAAVVPHALVEIPALTFAGAAALRWHASITAPPPEKTVGHVWVAAAADFTRVLLGLTVPLLLLAALVEALLTPKIVAWLYGM